MLALPEVALSKEPFSVEATWEERGPGYRAPVLMSRVLARDVPIYAKAKATFDFYVANSPAPHHAGDVQVTIVNAEHGIELSSGGPGEPLTDQQVELLNRFLGRGQRLR